MANLKLLAPLEGWCAPLDEVPDPVFAGRMVGEGLAIDPTGNTLYAPCTGEVLSIAAGKHAIALRSEEGIDVLMHVGIDTVGLAGEGFEPLTTVGAHVCAGDPLLRFDLNVLAERAKSLITPIIVTNGDQFEIEQSISNRLIKVGDDLLTVRSKPKQDGIQREPSEGQRPSKGQRIERLSIAHEHGLHARPAALIANRAKHLAAEIWIEAHGRSANASSAVAIMALGVRCGDEITLIASGPDAAEALQAVKETILAMPVLAERTKSPEVSSVSEASRGSDLSRSSSRVREPHDGKLRGVIASRGFAVGRAVKLHQVEIAVNELGSSIAHESAALDRARSAVRTRLEDLSATASGIASDVIAAHLEFLDDSELVVPAKRAIAQGKSAAFAWRKAVRDVAENLRALNDARMTERISDLLDLETQVLQVLSGASAAQCELPERAVVIAEDLKPSQLVSLDAERLSAICLAAGGPTSHVALLAASMGVPALVALGDHVLTVNEDAWLIVDAEQGTLDLAPDEQTIAAAEELLQQREQRKNSERAAAQQDCFTVDGTRIEVFANLASLAEAKLAATNGAEGCGLLRTEFLFLERASPPDEAEQLRQYQDIAMALKGRPLIIRTLDVGGDKPIPYLPLPAEENPALGLRGVRTSLWRPDLLRVQLKAILRVEPAGQCRILLPMVTDPGEIQAVRRMLDEVRRELRYDGYIELGAMIETPASALIANRLLRDVDFLSIGTNDLTQYTLAMDRGHSELAHRIDGLHPAVLSLISIAATAAHQQNKIVAVCGGLASEPAAVPVLIGLGIQELSIVPTLIPRIKANIRTLTIESCQRLAQRALEQETAEQVRALVNEFAEEQSRVTS